MVIEVKNVQKQNIDISVGNTRAQNVNVEQDVYVLIPDGYIQPSGTLDIVENGTQDVTEFASVNVNVPVPVDTRFYDILKDEMTELNDGEITSIRQYAFYGSATLKTVYLPNLTEIPTYLFYSCTGLETVDLPRATGRLGNGAFQKCTKLKNVNIPNITGFVNYAFAGCTELEILDLSEKFSAFGGGAALSSCPKLVALILRRTASIVTLGNKNNLSDSAIANGTGHIYVPRALVASYQSNTNWSTYPRFRALEDYTVDGTTTGALDMSKI